MAYVNVDIDVSDIDWSDIVEHVDHCGFCVVNPNDIRRIAELKSMGDPLWEKLWKDFVYDSCGVYWPE